MRPGSDGALALALCWVMIEEELYDEKFVANYVHGFDEFVQYAQHYRPETVESITGVPAERIRVLARRIAEANGATPIMYTGLEYSDSGVQAIRAVMTLWALAGQLDVPRRLLLQHGRQRVSPQQGQPGAQSQSQARPGSRSLSHL